MKPWDCPLFHTTCEYCGRQGWNYNAADAWTGTVFRCSGGCDPADVAAHQLERAIEYVKRQKEKAASEIVF